MKQHNLAKATKQSTENNEWVLMRMNELMNEWMWMRLVCQCGHLCDTAMTHCQMRPQTLFHVIWIFVHFQIVSVHFEPFFTVFTLFQFLVHPRERHTLSSYHTYNRLRKDIHILIQNQMDELADWTLYFRLGSEVLTSGIFLMHLCPAALIPR